KVDSTLLWRTSVPPGRPKSRTPRPMGGGRPRIVRAGATNDSGDVTGKFLRRTRWRSAPCDTGCRRTTHMSDFHLHNEGDGGFSLSPRAAAALHTVFDAEGGVSIPSPDSGPRSLAILGLLRLTQADEQARAES